MNPNDTADQNSDLPNLPIPKKHDEGSDASTKSSAVNPAAELIRNKLQNIYEDAPKASKELEEIKSTTKPLSKHQQFVADLQKEGRTMSQIQFAWNKYYEGLTDHEKNEVWKEFYDANKQNSAVSHHVQPHYVSAPFVEDEQAKEPIKQKFDKPEHVSEEPKTPAELKKHLIKAVSKQGGKKRLFRTLHSLVFGLSVGVFVIFIFLFSFFNDRFLAPFITPSRNVSAEALISDPSAPVGPNPQIIIPKINVEIPVVYDLPTDQESNIENSLEDGVVHYPTTPFPGQLGNGAIFGHSSNNILNPGKYKFAFVLLHDLVPGDTFTLDYLGKAYVYQVFEKMVVPPSDTNVLNAIPGKTATFSLITCDPPGTSINRLVVVGEQISPDPSSNTASTINQNTAPKPAILPSNSPSLWSRVVKALHL